MVSILTPTFNRRPFVAMMIHCFEQQAYPADKMEWLIADDGTDKIGDLVAHLPRVRYFSFDEKQTLGKKRNFLNSQAKGEILVHMDDDDYYPPERVRHAVEWLRMHPKAMLVGSSVLHIYFNDLKKVYRFGPYGPKHCTAASMAFRRELLQDTAYDETACMAEERTFLKDYKVPMEQLHSEKTILVLAHSHNTVDKRSLLKGPNVHETDLTIEHFVKDANMLRFITEELDAVLDAYEPGKPASKPDVELQRQQLTQQRIKEHEARMKKQEADKEVFRRLATINTMPVRASPAHEEEMAKLRQELQAEREQSAQLRQKMEQLVREKLNLARELVIFRANAR